MQSIQGSLHAGDKPTTLDSSIGDTFDTCTPAKRVKIMEGTVDKSNSSAKSIIRASSFVTPMPRSAPIQPTSLSKKEIESLLWTEAAYDTTSSTAQQKRSDYISWDDYFMAVAALSAHRSKDPVSPAGACIVDARNRIIGIGYNGFPAGCSDDCLPWLNASESVLHTPNPYKVHAEVNAILNKCSSDVSGARLYTHQFPCNECAKVLVQSRVAAVVYRYDPHPESDSSRASRIMFTMAGIEMRQYNPALPRLDLDFTATLDAPDQCACHADENNQKADATDGDKIVKHAHAQAVQYRDLLKKEAGYDPVETGSTKRNNYLSWDDYFMAISFLTAQRSKDPNTQVGACIVDARKRIVGLGYNGFPAGCSDDSLPWAREGDKELHKKYLYVTHAEVNAILNKCAADVKGAVLYVALFPCNDCAKMIIQAGIQEVVYMSDRYHDTDACRASRIMFRMAGVTLRKHIPTIPSIRVQLDASVADTSKET